ncbi:hypothetical protein DJ568_06330 [Mucilaginibacter hurinus]|uniref:Uncharacterized protein n=1 Tax=Mucilaginibacter hurinus TaxID=2201324 RepID=A0A367GR14_9SPHI|nr:hypothetical protein [Mucilaginibacter hurinus]RCH55508.1 hypothetical protein DJ568_06330 [Mucilaginibacter hurinus]
MGTAELQLIKRIRVNLGIVIAGLAISGVTAFPIERELAWLVQSGSAFPRYMQEWLTTIYNAVKDTNQRYPFLSYGTDWLAFAHLVLAILFFGPARFPVKNIWVIQFGMIACVAIFPLAFIAGNIRGIPFFWQLIDCSFGLIGIIPLYISYKAARKLEQLYFERGIVIANI